MAQRDADRTEKILGLNLDRIILDAVPHLLIPLDDGVVRVGELILLAVGEGSLLVVVPDLDLTLGRDSIDGLVVEDAAVVLEEDAILAGYVDKHGGHAVVAGAVDRLADLVPHGRGRTSRTEVARGA